MNEKINMNIPTHSLNQEQVNVPEFIPFYNKHYVAVDDKGRIMSGWSDGLYPEMDTTGAICINEHGGYQFRLVYSVGFVGDDTELPSLVSEENPNLYTFDGIPLYKWVDGVAIQRTEEEIEADRAAIPAPPPSPIEQIRADLDYIAIMNGVAL